MPSDPMWLSVALACALTAVVAILLAGLFRWSGTPGSRSAAAILGGVVAAILLGPAVFGQVLPDAHERLYRPPAQELRAELSQMRSEQAAELAALRATDVSDIALDEQAEIHRAERRPLLDAISAISNRHDSLWRDANMVPAAITMLLAPIAAAWGFRYFHRARERGMLAPLTLTAMATLIGAMLIPTLVALIFFDDFSPRQALLFGILFAAPGIGPATGRAGARITPPTMFISLVCLVLLAPGWASVAFTATGIAGFALAHLLGAQRNRALRKTSLRISIDFFLPAVIAIALVRTDPFDLASSWLFWSIAILALLISSDGRWLANWLAWKLSGAPRGTLWTRATEYVDSGAGTMQCLIVAMLAASDLPLEALVAGAIVGGAFVELTPALRRWVANILDVAAEIPRE